MSQTSTDQNNLSNDQQSNLLELSIQLKQPLYHEKQSWLVNS